MKTSEFDLIEKYFTFPDLRDDVLLAGGDDCASVSVPAGKQLLITTDTLIAGVHFPENTSARDIACKALMVNLSDLAAMGARPSWITLAITLAEIDDSWLTAFSTQLHALLTRFNIALIGGDTTRGHTLSITIQAMGLCDNDRLLRRDRARPGDGIFVTGVLGDPAIGLQALLNDLDDEKLLPCIKKLNRPEARLAFAADLVDFADCAIDVSDGLLADLGHILDRSDCGALIQLSQIPLSTSAVYYFQRYHNNVIDWSMVLTQGDDYELCFTLDKKHVDELQQLAQRHRLKVSSIGEITANRQLQCIDADGQAVNFSQGGFRHF